jgi:hypothetical protein
MCHFLKERKLHRARTHCDTAQGITHSRNCKSTGNDFAVSTVFNLSHEFCTKCSSISFGPVQAVHSYTCWQDILSIKCNVNLGIIILFCLSNVYRLQCPSDTDMNIVYSLHLLQNVFYDLHGHLQVVIRLLEDGHVSQPKQFVVNIMNT